MINLRPPVPYAYYSRVCVCVSFCDGEIENARAGTRNKYRGITRIQSLSFSGFYIYFIYFFVEIYIYILYFVVRSHIRYDRISVKVSRFARIAAIVFRFVRDRYTARRRRKAPRAHTDLAGGWRQATASSSSSSSPTPCSGRVHGFPTVQFCVACAAIRKRVQRQYKKKKNIYIILYPRFPISHLYYIHTHTIILL